MRGRPERIAATFVDVPPTSTTTAFATRARWSAPATDAAGPEYSVRAGALRKPARLVAPPSPRITMIEPRIPASSTPSSTTPAVRNAIGVIAALSAAVTVRSSSPYRPVSSLEVHTGRSSCAASSATNRSLPASSGANASAMQIAVAPASRRRAKPACARAGSKPSVTSSSSWAVRKGRPGLSSTPASRVRRSTLRRSGRRPIARTPTRPTSPSRRAFTAWVVEWVTRATRSGPMARATCSTASTTPAATPCSCVCVVGTTARSITVPSEGSYATALVKVPPTSTPTRSVLITRRPGLPPVRGAERSPRPEAVAVRWTANRASAAQRTCRAPRPRRPTRAPTDRARPGGQGGSPLPARDRSASAASRRGACMRSRRLLEALAVHGGEPDQDERRRRTERHCRPHAGLEELHPALVLETRDQPERHPEQHRDRDDTGERLHQLAARGRNADDRLQGEDRRHGREPGQGHTPQDRALVSTRLRRLQEADEHGEQQHGLEPLAEDDEEGLTRHQQGRGEAGVGELALGIVDVAAQLDDLVADLAGRRVRADELPDLGERLLGVERQLGVGDAERDLDELEVGEIAGLRARQGLFPLALFEEGQGLVDRGARPIELLDRLLAAD